MAMTKGRVRGRAPASKRTHITFDDDNDDGDDDRSKEEREHGRDSEQGCGLAGKRSDDGPKPKQSKQSKKAAAIQQEEQRTEASSTSTSKEHLQAKQTGVPESLRVKIPAANTAPGSSHGVLKPGSWAKPVQRVRQQAPAFSGMDIGATIVSGGLDPFAVSGGNVESAAKRAMENMDATARETAADDAAGTALTPFEKHCRKRLDQYLESTVVFEKNVWTIEPHDAAKECVHGEGDGHTGQGAEEAGQRKKKSKKHKHKKGKKDKKDKKDKDGKDKKKKKKAAA